MYIMLNWTDGMRLDSKLLTMSDLAKLHYFNSSKLLPFNYSYGCLSLVIDDKLIKYNILKIIDLKLYTPAGWFISLYDDKDLSIKILDLPLGETSPIYLNIIRKVKSDNGVELISFDLDLSSKFSQNHDECFQILNVKQIDDGLEIADCEIPLLSCNHPLIKKKLIEFKNICIILQEQRTNAFSWSKSIFYILLGFFLEKTILKLEQAQVTPFSIMPYSVYEAISDIHVLLIHNSSVIQNINDILGKQEKYIFDFLKPIESFNNLLEQLLKFCESKTHVNFIKFRSEGNKYIIDSLFEEFLASKNVYLIVRKKDKNTANIEIDHLKISSLYRNRYIESLSLKGIKLIYQDKSLSKFDFTARLHPFDELYLMEEGSELDFAYSERNFVFSAFQNSNLYDYFLFFE